MERKSKILGILAAMTITISIFAQASLIRQVGAADPSSWYMNVAGVLATDTYALYPFKTDKSLTIGFSKFGEMIDSISNIGMEYRDRDPFAPAAGAAIPDVITKNKWFQGWLINITYSDGARLRNVWAMAQHADKIDFGKDWIRVHSNYNYTNALTESEEDPSDQGKLISTGVGPTNGGRKTNGTATTEAITVLYNGPRMFIARTVTHIFDWDPAWTTDEPLVDIVFTLIFNKDKKEVIVLKDIKETTTKYVFNPITVPIYATEPNSPRTWYNSTVEGAIIQFSNRGEWDLGPAPSYDSYVHFYVKNGTASTDWVSEARSTVYDWNVEMDDSYHLNPTLLPAPYLLGGISDWGAEPKAAGTYDVAQIVASDRAYVGWAAFWPSLSNWHVAGGSQNKLFKSLSQNESVTDTAQEPFMSPYVIGEWDFLLTKTRFNATALEEGAPEIWREFDRQFRGVTVYGVTDNWTGDDAKRTGGDNVLDAELLYQLDEVFNPWDLTQAVHKKTNSWVDFHTVTSVDKAAADLGTDLVFSLTNKPVWKATPWEEYCNSSEQVEWGGARKLPARSVRYTPLTPLVLSANEPYELGVAANGVGSITIRHASVPAADTVIKVLYTTWTDYTFTTSFVTEDEYDNGANATFTAWTGANTTRPVIGSDTTDDCLGGEHTFNLTSSYMIGIPNGATNSSDYPLSLEDDIWFNATEIKVFKEDTTQINWLKLGDGWNGFNQNSTNAQNAFANVTQLALNWTISPPSHLDLHIDSADINIHYAITATYWRNSTNWRYNVTAAFTVTATITEHIPGRYEWVVVGNHSQPVDSVGAAMVAAAFKNKQVEIGNGGLDMKNMWGTNVPYLLDNRGSPTWRLGGPAWTNWYDSIGRLHLVDDWCTRYPVTTSNIITVAGPPANLVSEYFNEFADAIWIYGITGRPLMDVILAKSCWNTTKSSNYLGQTYPGVSGYGVITTYKDINGTVGFMIYGVSGDDTYYISKWFHEEGIFYLQGENPGVTTLILGLDYTSHEGVDSNPMPPNYYYDAHHPEVTILERLGTISEKNPHDP